MSSTPLPAWRKVLAETHRSRLEDEAKIAPGRVPKTNADMAMVALVARDAFWDGLQANVRDGSEPATYDLFVDWQNGLIARDEDWQLVTAEMRDQVMNASLGQIDEYRQYVEGFEEGDDHPDIPWIGLGHVEIVLARDGRLSATRIVGSGGYDIVHYGDVEDVGPVVRGGYEVAVEAMVPLALTPVGLPHAGVTIWEPWVPLGPKRHAFNPLSAARALEHLYRGGLDDADALVLSQLVGVVAIGDVLVDPERDEQFWAGEFVGDLIECFGEQTSEEAMMAEAPKLFKAIGG